MKRKYPLWGEFLKARREAKFRSAREFCARVQIGISYPQYSRYEAGEQLPAIDQALELCQHLGVNSMEGVLEWNRAQLPAEAEASQKIAVLLQQLRNGEALSATAPSFADESRPRSMATAQSSLGAPAGAPATGGVRLDEVIVFNRSHLRMFGSDPAYRDIFTYINSYAPSWISAAEISQAMDIPKRKLMAMLEELHDHGVILMEEENCLASKRMFYFPDDEDFFPMRNLNLVHNVSSIMRGLNYQDLMARRAYRGLITRELTAPQLDRLVNRLDEVIHDVVEEPETSEPQKIFSLCVVLGERFDRSRVVDRDVETRPGLTTHAASASAKPQAVLDISETRS